MSVWDGGSALREQVVLQQAARDGARVAATAYGPTVPVSTVANAVIASARDLPELSSTPGYLTISYPDAQSVQVRVTYAHSLITPVLRQVWAGGSGSITLQASATFYLPQLTPVPATLVPPTVTPSPLPSATGTPTPPPTSTPSATPTWTPFAVATATSAPTATQTPTPTVTPTRTATPSATPTPLPTATPTPGITTCRHIIAVPQLNNNSGYWFVVQLAVPSYLDVTWSMPVGDRENIELSIFSEPPPNPSPSSLLVDDRGNTNSLEVRTPQSNLTGSYSVYFFSRGSGLSTTSTVATLEYQSRHCP
jgi:hypothetical protein